MDFYTEMFPDSSIYFFHENDQHVNKIYRQIERSCAFTDKYKYSKWKPTLISPCFIKNDSTSYRKPHGAYT